MDTPSVYIACLASYNNGILHGRWISADQTIDALYDEIHEMLKESPIKGAEEWALHDFEGFGDIMLSEYEGLETIVKYVDFMTMHGELGQTLIANYGIEDAELMMSDYYLGCYDSEVDFAWHLFEEYDIRTESDMLRSYFDDKAFARDLFIDEYYSVCVNGKFYIFSSY